MIARCHNPQGSGFSRYGGVGIFVCDRWRERPSGFANFFADMGARPPGHSIERIDGTMGYTPENCRWATVREQNRNKSNNRKFAYRGKEYILADLAKVAGLGVGTLRFRLLRSDEGWTVEQAVETPAMDRGSLNRRARAIVYRGATYPSWGALAKASNVSWGALNNRLRAGWTVEDAVNTPVARTKRSH